MAGTAGVIFLPSPAQVLAALITVDGAGSGLDADLLDAQSSAAFESAGAVATHAALTAAHGATGAVVGETNTQVLSGKTLTTPTIASFANAAHTHQDAAGGGQLATAALANDAITFAKMQNIATDRLIGRDTAATGDPEEISLGASLEWSGGASIQRAALTGDVTATANSNATTIAVNAVTDTKLRDSGALSVIGRSANSGGDPADISAVAAGAGVLRESGSTIGFGTVATAGIANDAITFAKMQNIATDRLIGRDTAVTGDPEEISLGASLEWSGSASIQRAALTGDVTATANSNATTIANDAVTNAKAANMAQSTIKGRAAAAGTGDPTDLTAAEVATIVNASLTAVLLSDVIAPAAWTPVLADASSGGNVATGTATGSVYRIGKLVLVSWRFTGITTAGMTAGNSMFIRNFPVALADTTVALLAAYCRLVNVTFSGYVVPSISTTAALVFFASTSAGAGGSLLVSAFTTTTAATIGGAVYLSA